MKRLPIRDNKNKRVFDAIIDENGRIQEIEIKDVKGEHSVSITEIQRQIRMAMEV